MIFGIAWFAMMWLGLVMVALVVAVLFIVRRKNDVGGDSTTTTHQPQSEARQQVLEKIKGMHASTEGLRGRARIKALRRHMDSMSDGLKLVSDIRPAADGEPNGEWVIAPGSDPNRRILYIHGGSWIAGSPKSHRAITDRLSRLAHACVFAVDYRLMPENRYLDGIIDCQQAYRWMLDNGPDGKSAADFVVIAGDSAGGSHTLGLIAWIRDQNLPSPNAAIALSPSTELMLTSLSKRANLKTDAMLGPTIEKLGRIPSPLLWWGTVLGIRILPTSPMASPLRGKLHNLPPTLIHVSESELLHENAQRYVSKAQEAGSPVEMKTWPDMVHVWHMFTPLLPEAEEAFDDISGFLARVEAGSAAP
ncbi:alpha/beta hydrolase [Marinobacter sp. LV10MA510-1]|uniref:alpha/beta hydrolase n=1 Tax=Marinobacter sp. LV10MA510-1 TaxID=1415567 RepID=UPI000C00D775|nr:alpha/beta hydrolase [Marinobacter sp. LV10MA510-1]PFG08253.1 acetyl esterase/lipase [Marinobacter sp. LV10MA510-1]